MTDTMYPPSAELAGSAHANAETYAKMYAASIADPDAFWAKEAKRIDWIKPFTNVSDVRFAHPDVMMRRTKFAVRTSCTRAVHATGNDHT